MTLSRLSIVLILCFSAAGSALGAEFIFPSRPDGMAVLPEGRSARNLYVAGGSVSLKGPVLGDLVAAGGQVEVESHVAHALIAAGGDVRVESPVGGNAKLAGARLWVDSMIGDDLIAAGGTINVSPKAAVEGDAVLAGALVKLEGPVQGRAWIAGGQVVINASVRDKVVVRYGKSLTLGPSCRIAGKLECWGPKPPVVEAGAVAPSVDYHFAAHHRGGGGHAHRFFGIFGLIRLVAWIVAAWIISRLVRKPVQAVLQSIQSSPWRNLGLGFLILAAAIVGIPILFVTILGYYAALVAAALLGIGLLLSRLAAGFYVGTLLRNLRGRARPGKPVPFGWVVLGFLVLYVLSLIPVLGWVVSLCVVLLALGGMSRLAYRQASAGKQG